MLYRVHLAMNEAQIYILVVIGTDGRGSCKSNYHATTTAPEVIKLQLPCSLITYAVSQCPMTSRLYITCQGYLQCFRYISEHKLIKLKRLSLTFQ
jgi:hypothetical protein